MEENEKVDVVEEVKVSNEPEVKESKIGGFIVSYILNSLLYSVVLGMLLVGFTGAIISSWVGKVALALSGSESATAIIMGVSYLTIIVITTILVVKFATKDAMKKNIILPKDEQKTYGILVSIFAAISIIGILVGINEYINVDAVKLQGEPIANQRHMLVNLMATQKTEEQVRFEAKISLLVNVVSNVAIFGILATAQKNYLHKQIEIKNAIK